jgi:hypothetical protein
VKLRTPGLSLICVLLACLSIVACSGGGGSGSSTGPLLQPSPLASPSPALPTPPPPPTPTPIQWQELIGAETFPAGDTASGGHGAPVDGIPCDFTAVHFHIHTHVSLFYKGTQLAIPIAIGAMNPVYSTDGEHVVNAGCFYHLHNHDSSGLVHVENQAVGTFTLGQFFDIWGQPLSRTNVAGFMGPVLVYVAGCAPTLPFICDPPSVYSGDPRAIVLAQHEQVTLEVGGPYVWPPYYKWGF